MRQSNNKMQPPSNNTTLRLYNASLMSILINLIDQNIYLFQNKIKDEKNNKRYSAPPIIS